MQVRTLHFSDFLKLGRMHQADIGLNLPYSLVVPDLPLPAALAQHLPVNTANSSVYICENEGRLQAYAQARARSRRAEWEVLSLGVVGNVQPELVEIPRPEDSGETLAGTSENNGIVTEDDANSAPDSPLATETFRLHGYQNLNEAEPGSPDESEADNFSYISTWPEEIEMAWLKLLEYLVVDAGEKGVVRVYARLSSDSPQLDLFNQTGFHAYTHESLYHLNYLHPVERPPYEALKLKEQRKRDSWYIQQLYTAITPTFVQNSEQSTSRSWEIQKGYLPRPTRESGWLLMEADKASAYLHILSHRNRHLVRLMNLDTRRELLPDLVRFALSTIKAGSDTQVYCIVREYQMEQEAILEDAGFQKIIGKQSVLVKHTVQYVRATERQLVRGRESKLELARSVAHPRVPARLVRFIRRHLHSSVFL